MTQTADPISLRIDAEEVRQQLTGKHVCPFCGVIRADQTQPCPRCTMEDTNATRSATRQRIGPWFVLQARNPSAPGMKFATLLSLVKKGHVTPRSIVRGPTTHQLWTFAAKVRGVGREFGLCNWCGEQVETTAAACPHCDRPLEPPADPDTLLESGASIVPEMPVTASPATSDTGMDGGTSLDLQADEDFIAPLPKATPRPAQPSVPSVASPLPPSRSVAPANQATATLSGVNLPMVASKQEEAILTARELAAAFQLDFKPPPGTVVADGRVKKKGSALKTVFALVLISVIAVGIVMFARPDIREKSVTWLNETWTKIQSSLDAPPAKPTDSAPVAPAKTDAATVKNPAPKVEPKPEPKPVAVEPKPEPKPVAVEPKPEPKPVAVEPKPEPKPVAVEPKPEPKPVAVEPKPEPKPAVGEPIVIDPNLTPAQAAALARQLRSRAMDAEGSNWPEALRLYEAIERLPRDAWPADLQLRLKRARDAVK